jgi:hypothetical protein
MIHNDSCIDVSSGIDHRASLDNITDAFARQRLSLTVREVDGRFEAAVRTPLNTSSASEPAIGASPTQAAHRTWTAHLRQNGGSGQS